MFKSDSRFLVSHCCDLALLFGGIRKVEESGGKIVLPRKQVGEYGFYARVSDTGGNVVGVWQTAW